MKINETGFWENMTSEDINIEHAFDKHLCNNLKIFFEHERKKI